jgi:predicted outer membrane protein
MKRLAMVTVLCFCLSLIVGCASDKGPAETAIKAAEEAVNTVKAEAAKYAGDKLGSGLQVCY